MARYSNILKADEYEIAQANYKIWLDERLANSGRGSNKPVGAARNDYVRAYVTPFGSDGGLPHRVKRRTPVQALWGDLGSRVITTLGVGVSFVNFSKSTSPAKVNAFYGNGTRTRAQSKITKLWYLKYAGDNYSSPFGGASGTEKEEEAAYAVEALVRTAGAGKDYIRIWFKPEDIVPRIGI